VSSNWRAPGIDGITNFWIKNLSSLHQDLTNAYNECIKNPEACPEWFTTGTNYLLPNTEGTKILKIIALSHVSPHLEENNLLPIEQKGCRIEAMAAKISFLLTRPSLKR